MEKALRSLLKRGAVPYVIAGVIVLAGISGVAAATGTFSGSPTTTPTPSPAAATTNGQQAAGYPAAGGGDNIVQVINHSDSQFRMNGKVKLDQIPGPVVGPKNEAIAYSSCVSCQTMAVALQINLIKQTAHDIQPLNMAQAVNYGCTNCATYAKAIQYDIQVADPTQVPSDVRQLMHDMDATIKQIKTSGEGFTQAVTDVKAVIAQFTELAGSLSDKEDMTTDPMTPGASPMASTPASPSASATATASGAPTESSTPTPQPTSSP